MFDDLNKKHVLKPIIASEAGGYVRSYRPPRLQGRANISAGSGVQCVDL